MSYTCMPPIANSSSHQFCGKWTGFQIGHLEFASTTISLLCRLPGIFPTSRLRREKMSGNRLTSLIYRSICGKTWLRSLPLSRNGIRTAYYGQPKHRASRNECQLFVGQR